MVSRQQEEHHSSQRDNKFFLQKNCGYARYEKNPILSSFSKKNFGYKRLWKVVRCAGYQTVCNTNIRVTTSGETNKNALQMVFISFAKLFLFNRKFLLSEES